MQQHRKITEALVVLKPNTVFTVNSDNEITWVTEGVTPPTQAEIDAQIALMDVQRERAENYPPISEQLDKIYHEGLDAWKADIKAVKDKYPKE